MVQKRIIADIEECGALWKNFMEVRTVSDLWEFRLCFHRHYRRRPYFLVVEDRRGICGILPLVYAREEDRYVLFPGETWKGKTWLERTPVYLREGECLEELLSLCPERTYLRYLEQGNGDPCPGLEVDETGYLLYPSAFQFDPAVYSRRFAWKKWKGIRKEISSLLEAGAAWHVNRVTDFSSLVKMNVGNFGQDSYFFDRRFVRSFREVVQLLQERGWLRMVSLEINGVTAAVDLGALYGDTYVLFLGGTHPDFRGVAKVMNMHHIEFACARRLSRVDFLCGDFHWKKLWHLDPDPLYRYESPDLRWERSHEESIEEPAFTVPLQGVEAVGL
ncbi:MAG: GNAT family N-acetyltransferase [Deltaproteobacteria bacterium]|nr:GNAT family N-acetyltransferase [Deltaproteobacteria bacterium]